MIDESAKLKKYLISLYEQLRKQDNPVILREISVTAFKLMSEQKKDLICCPQCKEPGLIKTYNWAQGDKIELFNHVSTMNCENKHQWQHKWMVGDRFLFHEPVNQYYIYQCVKQEYSFKYVCTRVNGTRYFPEDVIEDNKLAYEN